MRNRYLPLLEGKLKLLGWLLLCLCAACSRPDSFHQALPAGSVVLAFGDSVTHGSGAARGQDWPALLAQASGWEVVNGGVPGDTASAARERLDGLLEAFEPELVLIELGGNDFLRQRPPGAVKEDLRWLVRQARASGAEVVLVAVPALSVSAAALGRLADAPLYAELAAEEELALVPQALADVLSQPQLRADRIHPNAEGYRALASAIEGRLRTLGLLR